jgi:hypothetical protein
MVLAVVSGCRNGIDIRSQCNLGRPNKLTIFGLSLLSTEAAGQLVSALNFEIFGAIRSGSSSPILVIHLYYRILSLFSPPTTVTATLPSTVCVMEDAVRPQQLLASKIASKLEVARKLLGWIEAEAAGPALCPDCAPCSPLWQDPKPYVFTRCSRRSIYAFP